MADDKVQEEETPQPQAVRGEDMALLQEAWGQYGRSVVTGVLLALVLVLGLTVYRQYRQGKQDQAAAALGNAVAAEDFEQFLARYPRSPSAPTAMLAMARAQFESGSFDEALATYTRFRQTHSEHPMLRAAEVAHAQTLEAAGRLAEAEAAFRALAATLSEEHYLQPVALLGIGRTLEQLGRWEEARAVYEDFIAAHPESNWADQAEVALRFVRRSLAAQRDAVSPAP